MPGLIPSSRIGKPGRKGLVPSYGCASGICDSGVMDAGKITAIIPGDILLTLPDLVELSQCTSGLGLCTEIGNSYVMTRQPSGIDWKILGLGKACNFNVLDQIHFTLRCVGDGAGGWTARHSILLLWFPAGGGPLRQGNVWVQDKSTVSSAGTVEPSYVKPHAGGFMPCVWADYPEASYIAL